ncbi:MAG: serine/threonine protein kinase [Planctomycetes bacterium]|nr:serine/threonine protein kinase [Planctomycetota bacterium]
MSLPEELYAELKELFVRASELEPGERASFVRRETEGREELRSSALRLLEANSPRVIRQIQAPPELARYELGAVLGEGGGGIVIEAWQRQPRRRVAIKLLREARCSLEQRFAQEIEILGRLSHPGIVQIIEGGITSDGRGFYVCELVPEARNVTTYIAAEVLTLEQRLALFAQICAAVAHAHERGVVHLDLKPANILVGGDGRVRIIDFGIAKLWNSADESERGAHGEWIADSAGSFASMAPEQARGNADRIGPAADLYALGLLLFELVLGEPARRFERRSFSELLREVAEGALPRLAARAPELPPGVRRAIEAATRLDPAARCASAGELALLALDLGVLRPARPGTWLVAVLALAPLAGAQLLDVARSRGAPAELPHERNAALAATPSPRGAAGVSGGELADGARRSPRRSGPRTQVSPERERAFSMENRIAEARASGGFEALVEETERRWTEVREERASLVRTNVLTDYAILCYARGREDEALRHATEALAMPQMRPMPAARLNAVRGWIYLRQGQHAETRELAERTAARARGGITVEESEAQAAIVLGVLRGLGGELEEGRAQAMEGLRSLDELLGELDPRRDWARAALALLPDRR